MMELVKCCEYGEKARVYYKGYNKSLTLPDEYGKSFPSYYVRYLLSVNGTLEYTRNDPLYGSVRYFVDDDSFIKGEVKSSYWDWDGVYSTKLYAVDGKIALTSEKTKRSKFKWSDFYLGFYYEDLDASDDNLFVIVESDDIYIFPNAGEILSTLKQQVGIDGVYSIINCWKDSPAVRNVFAELGYSSYIRAYHTQLFPDLNSGGYATASNVPYPTSVNYWRDSYWPGALTNITKQYGYVNPFVEGGIEWVDVPPLVDPLTDTVLTELESNPNWQYFDIDLDKLNFDKGIVGQVLDALDLLGADKVVDMVKYLTPQTCLGVEKKLQNGQYNLLFYKVLVLTPFKQMGIPVPGLLESIFNKLNTLFGINPNAVQIDGDYLYWPLFNQGQFIVSSPDGYPTYKVECCPDGSCPPADKCPLNTCAILCGNTVCCYDKQGKLVKSFNV